MIRIYLFAAVMFAFCGATSANVELVRNGDFGTLATWGTTPISNASPWAGLDSTVLTYDVVNTKAHVWYATNNTNAGRNVQTGQQLLTMAAWPDMRYTLSADFRAWTGDGPGEWSTAEVRLYFYNSSLGAGWQYLTDKTISYTATTFDDINNFHHLVRVFDLPVDFNPGTNPYAPPCVALWGHANGAAGWGWDNVSLVQSATPEPATLALLSLGGLFLLRRRNAANRTRRITRAVAGLSALGMAFQAVPAFGSAVFDYNVTFQQGGLDLPMKASAWMPDDVPLRGILYLPPCWGGDTRYDVRDAEYQAFATALGMGIIGFDDDYGFPGQYQGATTSEVRSNVQRVLDGAAAGLSCPQIRNAPMAFYGFSKGGWMDGVLAASLPERTICVAADKSNSWIDSTSKEAAFVPAIFIGGSKDNTAPGGAAATFYVWRYPNNGQAALVEDWNVGHWGTNFSLVETFIAESMAKRYPAGQLPSAVPGNPLTLNQIDPGSGWLVEVKYWYYNGSFSWIRCADAAPASTYSKAGETCWTPSQTMAMVLRAQNGADPSTGQKPVTIWTATPTAVPYAYDLGQSVDLQVVNATLNLVDVTGVQIFHEGQLIGDFSSLSAAGVSQEYLLTERGVHTFWTQVTYLYNGQPTLATNYLTLTVIPEPATAAILCSGSFTLLLRGRRRTGRNAEQRRQS